MQFHMNHLISKRIKSHQITYYNFKSNIHNPHKENNEQHNNFNE